MVGALLALLGCETASSRTTDDEVRGTRAMADTLAAINKRLLADPRGNPFLNSARASAMKAILPSVPPDAQPQLHFMIAQEQLLAGQTVEAIAGLEALIGPSGLKIDATRGHDKPFFDLLAIAYLRLGEQENCLYNPAANMCILPLKGGARHTRQEGARKAIAIYQQLLRAFPDDRGSRWLLNIAQLAVGEYPAGVAEAWRIPGLDAKRDASFPQFNNVAGDVGLDLTGLSGGLSVEDFNRDGLLDLFFSSFGVGDQARLFLADGHGGYRDATRAAGLDGIVGGLNNTHADYDNDGFEDILILRGGWTGDAGVYPMSLLHNNRNGTFSDVTVKAGLANFRYPRHSAAWADFNLDGKLDLFVGNESARRNGGAARPSELYMNNGDGTFTEVSRQDGIVIDEFVKGVAWGDVNNDGLPDLFASVFGGPNRLFLNKGGSASAWRFEEAADAGGAALPINSFPTWFWDFDQDGWEDLLVLSYDVRNGGALHETVANEYLGRPLDVILPDGSPAHVESSRLYRNNHDGTFSDVTKAAGLAEKAIFAMGSNFGDLDNDGWFDFYVGTGNPDLRSVIPNRMFRGNGKRFTEVTLEGGFGHLQKGHATAFVDLDQDGDEDVYMVMGGAYEGDRFTNVLFENPGSTNGWITLELEGRAANRSAIGARVELVLDGPTPRHLYRTVGTGGSFGAGSLRLHVGLGKANAVKTVRVRWPDAARSTTEYSNLGIRKTWKLAQGQPAVELTRPVVPFAHGKSAGHASMK